MDTLQSILEEPSKGSNATQNLPKGIHMSFYVAVDVMTTTAVPAFEGSTIMGSSFSSETNTAQTCELYRVLMNISLDNTSSFFCSSPVVFSEPASPSK